jgi:hypothetical protein
MTLSIQLIEQVVAIGALAKPMFGPLASVGLLATSKEIRFTNCMLRSVLSFVLHHSQTHSIHTMQ